jgi:hypothetical protein
MNHVIQIVSTVKCIVCGHKETQRMPCYAAKTYYQCPSCNHILRPLENKCCIYCSYGSTLCPPMQRRVGISEFTAHSKQSRELAHH